MKAKFNIKATVNGKRTAFKPGDTIPDGMPSAELAYLKKVGAVADDDKAEQAQAAEKAAAEKAAADKAASKTSAKK